MGKTLEKITNGIKKIGEKVKTNLGKLMAIGRLALLGSFGGVKNVGAQFPDHPVNFFVTYDEGGESYNALQTKAERDYDIQEKLNSDWVDTIPYDLRVWNCNKYSLQLRTDAHNWGEGVKVWVPFGEPELLYDGYNGTEINEVYAHGGSTAYMGSIPSPIYGVSLDSINGEEEGHSMNCILTGDNALNWDDWNFIEPQQDKINRKPGEGLPMDCNLSIKYSYLVNNNELKGLPLIKFKIENGNPSLDYVHPYIDIITQRESNPPVITIESPLENQVFNTNEVPFKAQCPG